MELATPYYGASMSTGAGPSAQPVAPASGPQGPAAFGFNFSGGLTSDHLPVIATVALLGLALILLHARG